MTAKPLLLAIGLALSSASVQSQTSMAPGQAGVSPPAGFEAMDRNDDGLVSSSEHEEAASAMFDAMDGDGDDSVSSEEMEAAHRRTTGRASSPLEQSAAQKIRALDANEDGVLSDTEHRDGARALFQRMDYDSDGNLTPQEFDAGRDDQLQSGS